MVQVSAQWNGLLLQVVSDESSKENKRPQSLGLVLDQHMVALSFTACLAVKSQLYEES